MGAKSLPNATIVPEWASLIGALAGCLRALGDPYETAWLIGVTGHAFRCALTEADGVIAAGPAAVAVDFARVAPLYRNGGRAVRLIESDTRVRDYPKRREEALKQIRRSIDRGRPVVAYDLHIPEFGIIHGYDDRARTLSVSSMISQQYGATLAEARWPVPERSGRMIVLLLGEREKIDPRRALSETLRFAVAYSAAGEPGDPTGAAHGFAAFSRWREALAGGAPIDASGHARLIQMLQSARRDAATFLRAQAATLPPALAAPLTEAAAAYERVALACSRLATLFPYPGGGAISSAGMRQAAAASLRQVETDEHAAVERLADAIVQIERGH